jgi:hypothetical protein
LGDLIIIIIIIIRNGAKTISFQTLFGRLNKTKQRNADSGINRTDKAHVMSVRPHNRCHHKVKLIDYISCRYTLLQYYVQYNLQ